MNGDTHELIRCYGSTHRRIAAAARAFGLSHAEVVRLSFDQAGTVATLERESKRRRGDG